MNPMSTDHHEATAVAMKAAGCGRNRNGFCSKHPGFWHTDLDVCRTVDDLVRIGYEAGRRDALTEVAAAMSVRCEPFGAPVYVCKGTGFCDCFDPNPLDFVAEEADRG